MSEIMYERISKKIDSASEEIKALALSLHEHPELAFQEHFACEALTEILEKYGYIGDGISGYGRIGILCHF